MRLRVFSNCTLAAGVFLTAYAGLSADSKAWVVDSQADWKEYVDEKENLEFKKGFAEPTDKTSTFRSKLKSFPERVSAKSISFDQSPVWDNWEKVENLGPINMGDAPVFVTVGPNNYWAFGRYGDAEKARSFKGETARLEGFDVPLLTTPFKNQYNAPGGLKPGLGGYHAWQSRDMVNWVHHGPVSEEFSRWVTTAEYADGKLYLYYDFPNDMDPFLYIDDNLFDGKPGKNMGLAFPDPSMGSDCTFIRDEKGHFHVIYEDWSPVNARAHAYDSPLAGHAVSKDGMKDFKILKPAVDERTTPTGKTKTWRLHANQHPKEKSYRNSPHPARFPDDHYKETTYQVHSPKQDAYGDWAAIRIGTQYYLFGDYDSAKAKDLSVARFTSSNLDKEFTYCGKLGEGHPDPDVGFAEGRFYLFTQQKDDFTSPGPWVERVDARVGVDTDNDGKIDIWTDWKRVKESYDYVEGFAKHVKRSPAALDLSGLPAGYGFQFEFKMTDTTANMSKPIMDTVTLTFTATAELAASRPNVILVMTDDQGYGDLSCHGHPFLKTPNLDKLHSQSTRFTDYHVSPTCAPTRAALMSGKNPFEVGVTHTILERERMALGATTVAEVLKKAGYTTGIFGKWHLGEDGAYQPGSRGFDEVFIHGAGGIGQEFQGSQGDVPNNKYFDPTIRHNGSFVKTSGYCTDVFTQEALRWIKQKKDEEKPFFAYVAYNAPHSPYVVADSYRDAMKQHVKADAVASFLGMIVNIDENVGLLMNKLEEWNLADNTVLIFTCDNGSAAGAQIYNAGMKGSKGSVNQGGSRVPLFVRWPGVTKPGADVDALSRHIDIFPTFAELAGADISDLGLEGRSLVPLLENPQADWPDRKLFFHGGRWPKKGARGKRGIGDSNPDNYKNKTFAVRTEKWRLVEDSLYDIEKDPGEKQNVFSKHPEIVQELVKSYEAFWKRARPLMVNEDAPLNVEKSFKRSYLKQKDSTGIPKWNVPQL